MINNNSNIFSIAIIGAGPAGLTAALFLERNGYAPVIYEKGAIGGQAARAPFLENVPGIQKIRGIDFIDQMIKQVEHFRPEGAKPWLLNYEVIGIQRIEDSAKWRVETAEGFSSIYDAVIIASGADPAPLNVSNEKELVDEGFLSYCVNCDGFLHRDDDAIAVIGDGNTAIAYIEELIQITKPSTKIYLFTRGDTILCEETKKYVLNDSKVIWIKNILYDVDSIVKDETGKNVIVSARNGRDKIMVQGVFAAIGQKRNQIPIKLCKEGATFTINTISDFIAGNHGIFGAGDLYVGKSSQVILSCADGMQAAEKTSKYLSKRRGGC